MAKQTISVKGMACESCAANVHKHLTAIQGVSDAVVSLADKCAQVSFDPQTVSVQQLIEAIREAGYEPVLSSV